MDEVQIEIKDELIHQDEELQTKKKPIVTSLIVNRNILNEEVHMKNEPIDQGIILPSTEQGNTSVKYETIEMKTNLRTEVEQESFGEFEAHEQVKNDLITSKGFKAFMRSLSVSLVPNLGKTLQSPKSDLTPWTLNLFQCQFFLFYQAKLDRVHHMTLSD